MRRFELLLKALAIVLVVMGATARGQPHNHRSAGECGIPVHGLTLCLSPSDEPGRLWLVVRNAEANDTVLNLGAMLANGARQYATAVTLTLRDLAGKEHHGVLAEPALVGGRLDPFVVPLPKGASLKLPLIITRYALDASGGTEDFRPDPKQSYTVQAQFTGKVVSQAEVNLDSKGLALMPYWTGAVVSNSVITTLK
jgi:hypothetical protein